MAQRLWAVANVTGQDAKYMSTEHANDKCALPNNTLTHTGDNYFSIADCSDSRYFAEHHDEIAATDGSWVVSIWNDDNNGHLFYWTNGGFYSTEHPVTGSNDWLSVGLVIAKGPIVYCANWS
jgi:hypothetical protein